MKEEKTVAASLAAQVAKKYGLTWDKGRLVYFKTFHKGRYDIRQDFTINMLSELVWTDSTWVVGEMLDNAKQELEARYNGRKRVWWKCSRYDMYVCRDMCDIACLSEEIKHCSDRINKPDKSMAPMAASLKHRLSKYMKNIKEDKVNGKKKKAR